MKLSLVLVVMSSDVLLSFWRITHPTMTGRRGMSVCFMRQVLETCRHHWRSRKPLTSRQQPIGMECCRLSCKQLHDKCAKAQLSNPKSSNRVKALPRSLPWHQVILRLSWMKNPGQLW